MANRGGVRASPLAPRTDEASYAWMEGDRDKLTGLLPEMGAHQKESGWNNYFLSVMYFFLEDRRGASLLSSLPGFG